MEVSGDEVHHVVRNVLTLEFLLQVDCVLLIHFPPFISWDLGIFGLAIVATVKLIENC